MKPAEAIDYIHSFGWEQHAPGLNHIRELLALLGNPERELRFVHVAGTNGKGSTCAMLASMLQKAGYRVGLNTSPHLVRFEERIQVNGELIPGEDLAALVERIRPAADAMAEHPTEFELITALAMLYFQDRACDIVVLETGLGGELDASNVIDTPEAAVLAAMGMDHCGILGNTLAEVAQAKAGIIKSGGRVVSFGGCPEADRVFRETCRDRGAALREVEFTRIQEPVETLEGTTFTCAPYGQIHLPLPGDYQTRNALLAITAAEALREAGWKLTDAAIREGIADAHWPGRLELLRTKDPAVLLDGAHNPHGMRAAVESLRKLLPGQKAVLVLGIMADKDVEEMLELLTPVASAVFTVTPDSPRAMAAEELARRVEARGIPAQPCETPAQALRQAAHRAGTGGAVCVLGSLYLAGEILETLETL